MARVSPKQLDALAAHIAKVSGKDLAIGWAYGRPRLVGDKGSRDVSPRLPSGQLYDWMHAYLKGWERNPVKGGPRRRRRGTSRTRRIGRSIKTRPARIGKVRRRTRRNPATGPLSRSESAMWRRVQEIARGLWIVAPLKGNTEKVRVRSRELHEIATAMLDQLAYKVHTNPMLALVGANPRGKYLGDVKEIRYLRKVGAHSNRRFKHAFKARACLYAMPDGSIRVVG
jgi:hypothetical protein